MAPRLHSLGREYDDIEIVVTATRSMLWDVIDAAGGVERAIDALRSSITQAETTHAVFIAESDPTFPTGIMDPRTEDAWYSVEELLMWARPPWMIGFDVEDPGAYPIKVLSWLLLKDHVVTL